MPGSCRAAPPAPVTLFEGFRYWLKLGFVSFGGPAGQISMMHTELVERRRWVSEHRFLHALNYTMVLPGPEAQQLATYIGWLLHRTLGGLVAGILFVLPGAVVILVLSVLYAGFQEVTLVRTLFFGIKAAVLAVVIEAVLRIGKRALKNRLMYALAGAAFIAIFFFDVAFPIIVIAAGVIGLVGGHLAPDRFLVAASRGSSTEKEAVTGIDRFDHTRPTWGRAVKVTTVCLLLWFGPIAVLAATLGLGHVYVQQGFFFSKMAVVTFGGAYAVLAYVAQEAVNTYGWLGPGEMLDGLGMAETTPGPLIMVLQFVGFMGAYRNPGGLDPMLAGTFGALVTTWVTFVPCFLWILLGAPYIEALRGNRSLGAALSAITAAVVGVVLNLAVWFAIHVIFAEVGEVRRFGVKLLVPAWVTVDIAALTLTVAALIAMLRFKIGMIPTLATSAALGALYSYAMAP